MRVATLYFVVLLVLGIWVSLAALAYSDEFTDRIARLEAANAKKDCHCAGPTNCICGEKCVCIPCQGANTEPVKRKQGSKKACTDGLGDWTWETSEGGYWWRYRPDWQEPVVSFGSEYPFTVGGDATGSCSSGSWGTGSRLGRRR